MIKFWNIWWRKKQPDLEGMMYALEMRVRNLEADQPTQEQRELLVRLKKLLHALGDK